MGLTIEEDVMRKRLVKLLLDRALHDTCPEYHFFLAGPARPATRAFDGRQAALLADLRRRRRVQPPIAA